MYQTYHVCTTKYKSHPGRSVKSLQQEMFILELFLGLLTKRLSIIFQAMRLITKKASFLFFVGIDSRDYFLKGSYEASCVLLGSLYGCISISASCLLCQSSPCQRPSYFYILPKTTCVLLYVNFAFYPYHPHCKLYKSVTTVNENYIQTFLIFSSIFINREWRGGEDDRWADQDLLWRVLPLPGLAGQSHFSDRNKLNKYV